MNAIVLFLAHVLAQHPQARMRLRMHAGKSVRIDAAAFALSLAIDAEGGVVSGVPDVPPDVTFRLDPAQWPLLLSDPDAALKAVRLEGDAELAQLIGALMREVRWDAEEDLSRVIGDVPAFRAMQALRTFTGWGRDASQRLAGTTAAFLADEEAVLVRREVAGRFATGVAEARDACARLEKRVELLEAARKGAPAG
jgi:ubiquinone biosynthesis protein UbiJ